MIHTVIFDIGNVLMKFDYMPYIKRLLGDDDVIYRVNGAIWRSGYWNEMDRGRDSEETIPLMLAEEPEYREEILLTLEKVDQCMIRQEYAIPWIQELKNRGYQVLFLSNYSHFLREKKPEVLDFIPYMDGGVFSCDVRMVKPDQEIYQTICEKYELKPEECVFLDDNLANIQSAKRYGFHTILFTDYRSAREKLESVLNGKAYTMSEMV